MVRKKTANDSDNHEVSYDKAGGGPSDGEDDIASSFQEFFPNDKL